MSDSKVIVVTGVSSGIGRATAEMFAKLGHRVFGTVRSIVKVKPLSGVEFVEMDISDDVSVRLSNAFFISRSSYQNLGTSQNLSGQLQKITGRVK